MQEHQNKPAAAVRKVAVLGAGAWGTAVAMALAQRHDVLLWGRNGAALQEMAASAKTPNTCPAIHSRPA